MKKQEFRTIIEQSTFIQSFFKYKSIKNLNEETMKGCWLG
jgi:hypothetical protein